MRLIVIMGVVMLGLLGAAFWLNDGPDPRAVAALVPLETTLERPLVLYVDGDVGDTFQATLLSLDARAQALATQAAPKSLIDVDTYVMLRADWNVFRSIRDHDLSEQIRKNTADKADNTGLAWFEVMLSAPERADQRVLVILGTDAALANLSEFCFALTVYELARFAQNGSKVMNTGDGPGSHWTQCRARGWTSAADLPAPK